MIKATGMRNFALRFLRDNSGQDLIEYALLTGMITSGFVLLGSSLRTSLASAFTTFGNARNNLWIPGDPTATP